MSNNINDFLEYNLSQNAYATFDATTLKDFIIERLNDNEKFTDQNYEGSNLAAIIDIIAYSYHVLLFYLNTTASEVNFDQATIYENMNKIVKIIGYKPTGKQTSVVPIRAVATSALPIGDYTIKKYSFFLIDGIQYTFLSDYSFNIATQQEQNIPAITDEAILYQGVVGEYPDYVAHGEKFETLPIVVDNIIDNNDDNFIADNTISVYVKEQDSNIYFQYTEVDSLYLTGPFDRVYEKRLNESGHFEIKFGDGISGRILHKGDVVAVNYILSDNEKGIISKNAIAGNKLFEYSSQRWDSIFADIETRSNLSTYVNTEISSLITFSNPNNSSLLAEEESVDEIRQNSARLFSSQLRLVTPYDYEAFIAKTYNNVINSVKVIDNVSYLNEYINYFYTICVDPIKSNRVLINQINFADSCDFNNVNVFIVPRFDITGDNFYPEFLNTSIKNLIVKSTANSKMIGHEVIPRDPIYMAYGLGFSNKELSLDVLNQTKLYIVRETTNKINKDSIIRRVAQSINNFFAAENNQLGQTINLSNLLSDILSIDGIKHIYTKNEKENITFDGVSFLSFNPLYPNSDIHLVNQNIQLPFFKFPYYYRPLSIGNNIAVVDE